MLHPYEFTHTGKRKEGQFIRYQFSFKTKYNRTYIVYADEFDSEMFIVKFFLKNHRHSKNRFRLMANDFDAKRVLDTCVSIAGFILNLSPQASFGFIGEPRIGESKFRTKRFLVYLLYAARHYNPIDWEHYADESISAYFLLNTQNKALNIQHVQDVFKDYIEF
ncbi:MAG: hypothetical protein HWE07_00810 [Cytophagia bacterium]|nr:hypothetical protein [Cytophagia bacterium]